MNSRHTRMCAWKVEIIRMLVLLLLQYSPRLHGTTISKNYATNILFLMKCIRCVEIKGMGQKNIWTEYASTELHNGTGGRMVYVSPFHRKGRSASIPTSPFHRKRRSASMPTSPLRSANSVSLCTQTHTVAPWHQNSSAPYPNNPLRDGDAFIDVSSFILFFSSEFSSLTVCISSFISVSLVLNSYTNFCRFCNISNVFVLVLTAAMAAIDDAVGTPMTRDIMNGMVYYSSHT